MEPTYILTSGIKTTPQQSGHSAAEIDEFYKRHGVAWYTVLIAPFSKIRAALQKRRSEANAVGDLAHEPR